MSGALCIILLATGALHAPPVPQGAYQCANQYLQALIDDERNRQPIDRELWAFDLESLQLREPYAYFHLTSSDYRAESPSVVWQYCFPIEDDNAHFRTIRIVRNSDDAEDKYIERDADYVVAGGTGTAGSRQQQFNELRAKYTSALGYSLVWASFEKMGHYAIITASNGSAMVSRLNEHGVSPTLVRLEDTDDRAVLLRVLGDQR